MRVVIREDELYPAVRLHDPEQREPDGGLTWDGDEWHEVPDHVVVALHSAWLMLAAAHRLFYRWEGEAGLRSAEDRYVVHGPGWVESYEEEYGAHDEVEAVGASLFKAAVGEAHGEDRAKEDAP